MKKLINSVVAAGLVLTAAPLAIAPASAQAIKGIAIVNIQAIMANSSAFKTAEQQRPVTYKAQLDQAESRRLAITNQLKPLYEKFEADRKAAKPDNAALQQQAVTIQQIEQNGQQEIQGILQPVALSRAYVEEQINDKLDQAIEQAAKKAGASLVMTPDNVVFADNAYNLNQGVLAELNALIPSAQLVPPQGWLPRSMREQQAAAQAQQAPAPAPAGKPTSGR
jgi:Skp family chaperone for outer membrane proteins